MALENDRKIKTPVLDKEDAPKIRTSSIRVLLIEDGLDMVSGFYDILSHPKEVLFDVTYAKTFHEALEFIHRTLPDVILTDLFLSDKQGLAIIKELHTKAPNTPIIVLTDSYDELGFEAVKKGAQDYLVKEEINPKLLLRVICYAIERKRIQEELRQTTSELRGIFRALPDLLFRVDKNGVILEYNAGRNEDLYMAPAEFLGKKMQDVLPVPVAQKFDQAMAEVSQKGSLVCFEYPLQVPAGKKVFEARILPLLEDQMIMVVRDVTERKQAQEALYQREASLQKQQEALRESESRYRSLIEMAPDTIFTISSEDMTITSLNPAFEKITGWPRSKWIGRMFVDIVHPEDLPTAIGTFGTILKEQQSSPIIELRFLAKSGRYLTGEVVASPLMKDEKVVGVFGVVRDITERKKTEEELRIFSRAIEQSPSTVMLTDVRGRIQYVNPKFTEVTGYTPEEVIGKNPNILKSGKMPEHVYKKLWETVTTGNVWRGEFYNKKKDGNFYWGVATILPIRNSGGEITHFLGVEENITEHKKAAEIIHQQSVAITSSMDGMAILNAEGEYIYLNEAHAKVYGYDSAKELTGKTWHALYDQKELQRFQEDIMPALWKNGQWRGEAIGKKRDGSFFPQEISLTAIEGGGLVCVVRDITDRKKSEGELNDYRRHLENLVEERTRELRHSERLAATGRLAASIAHEINNPLQGITTHLEIIRDALPKKFAKKKNYDSVRNNIEKIKEIVLKLLDTYRGTDEGKTNIDLNTLMSSVALLIEHQLELRGTSLRLQLSENLPMIYGWHQQLHQVFLNLILNAQDSIKAKGEIVVTTCLSDGLACVSVADTGEGIKREDMDHLFEPFFTTKKESGTGLGLFVSQGIIKEHNGTIKVKSELGKGSIFTVFLPIGGEKVNGEKK